VKGPERYDRLVLPFVRPYTKALLSALRLPPGATVLDHGAGTGEVTLAIHRRWPDTHIVALDPSGPMLTRLQEKAGTAPWLTIYKGELRSASNLGPFDLCVSQLSLVFVSDAAVELAILRRITRPEGHLAVIVLRGAAHVMPFFAYWSAVRQVLPKAIAPEEYPHHRFANAVTLRLMAEEAGWRSVHIQPIDSERVCAEGTLWRWLSTTLPVRLNTGETVDMTTDPQAATVIRRALVALVEPYRRGPSYHLPMGAWLLTGGASSSASGFR
jgi:ubiquinone/menaquinone biosynthesis C-methylase UbiE